MESLYRAIQTLQKRLADADILSIVIGGIAVGIWGEPRATRDADLKVQLERKDAERLLAVLTSDYVSLLPDPLEALRRQAMVFVQDAGGVRMDLLLADTSYDVVAVQRGREVEVQPGMTLMALQRRRPGDLQVDLHASGDHEDVRGVTRRQGAALDHKYVLGWLRQFEEAFDDSTLVAEYRQLIR